MQQKKVVRTNFEESPVLPTSNCIYFELMLFFYISYRLLPLLDCNFATFPQPILNSYIILLLFQH